jgi:alpha-L-arabinofuranosidase
LTELLKALGNLKKEADDYSESMAKSLMTDVVINDLVKVHQKVKDKKEVILLK